MSEVSLKSVSVELAIYNSRARGLKNELIRRAVGGQIEDSRDKTVTVVRALSEIDLMVKPGERVGLIGHNGAGKTTLLRVLGRIYPPTSGQATISGRVSSLIDLSMGMDPESTGYENIVMRGVMLGLKRSEARALIPDVEEFSELGDYLSLPIRTYSTGMMLRLAFAVSTAVHPDILILDEVIGVGDAGFAQRAQKRLIGLIDKAEIMFLASHANNSIRQFCQRSVWLDHGRIKMDGPTDEVLSAYEGAHQG